MKAIRILQLSALAALLSLKPAALATHPICLFSQSGPFEVLAGQTLTFSISVDDLCGNQFNCDDPVKLVLDAAQTLPPGVTLTPALGTFFFPPAYGSYTFSWTPTEAQAGTYDLTFHAEDSKGNRDYLGACSVHITVIPVNVPSPCPLTQGYWKNHADKWPVSSLTLGSQTYSKTELLNILNKSVSKDASLILAHQLIATLLNYANGADKTLSNVNAAIANAQSLLSSYSGKLPYKVKTSSSKGQQMVAAAKVLDEYNNRHFTTYCPRD